jgi:hypothetical protein
MKVHINIKELTSVLVNIKRKVCLGNWNELQDEEGNSELQVTVGYSHDKKDWDIQTGDNSFSGAAYFHPVWGVSSLYPGCNCKDVANDIINQIYDMIEE